MQFDKDGDKKLSRDELPEFLQSRFERMDTNGDGFIDAGELAELRAKMKSGGGGRPPGPRGDGSNGDRPAGPTPGGEKPGGEPRAEGPSGGAGGPP
jgi:collagen type III alpha